MRTPTIALWGLALAVGWSDEAVYAADDAEGIAFFESKIRPVLVKHCYQCHSADSKILRGGLLLDSREGVLTGGDSGPTLAPGKPEESLLMESLRYESYEMPPEGKLPDAVIADFERWIAMGAPDPRAARKPANAGPKPVSVEEGKKFWSFQPVVKRPAPDVKNVDWPRTEIDRFILARLEREKLTPAADADPRTLLRRVYYDLIGLPPTPSEMAEFLSDPSPEAFAAVVNRLLDSPRFGERWGRHWLDVARFAESSGGGRSIIFHDAWRYRNYVVDSFNRDKPFDVFITEHLAGDLLPYESDEQRAEQLVATAFLVLGPINYETQDKELLRMDVVDEQIDTIGKAFLGMTIGCARCHDHKFDPIPTNDYYALAGILKSTKSLTPGNVSGFVQRTLPVEPEREKAVREYEQAYAKVKTSADKLKKALDKLESQRTALSETADPAGIVVDDAAATIVGEWMGSTSIPKWQGAGYIHDSNAGKGEKSVSFVAQLPAAGLYEVRLSYNVAGNRASNTPVTIRHAEGKNTIRIDQRRRPPIDGMFLSLGRFLFAKGPTGLVTISNEGTDGTVIADAVQFVPASESPAPAKPPTTAELQQYSVSRLADLPGVVVDNRQAELAGNWKVSTSTPAWVGNDYVHDEKSDKGTKSVRWTPDLPKAGVYEVRLAYNANVGRTANAPIAIHHAEGISRVLVDQQAEPAIGRLFQPLGRFRFEAGKSGSVALSTEGTEDGYVIADAVQFVPAELLDASPMQIAAPASKPKNAAVVTKSAKQLELDAKIEAGGKELAELQAELKRLAKDAPEPLPKTMSVQDEEETGDAQVCIRGNVHNQGYDVPRGFLTVASSDELPAIPTIAEGESGRRELAQWIASSKNPLTARVFVNRIWTHLFGVGIVSTPDNFGKTGEAPTNPELLDYLAARCVEEGWSTKQMIREIMFSRVYQLSSEKDAKGRKVDPENRLLSRMNRRRMDAEALRDTMLVVAARLDATPSEAVFDAKLTYEYGYKGETNRRSVYLPVLRNTLYEIFEVFDFADPNLVLGRRNTSTLPTQALYLMNSPFVMDEARHAAESLLAVEELDDEGRAKRAFELALCRPPSEAELELVLDRLHAMGADADESAPDARVAAWTHVFHALFACVDFRYLK